MKISFSTAITGCYYSNEFTQSLEGEHFFVLQRIAIEENLFLFQYSLFDVRTYFSILIMSLVSGNRSNKHKAN